MSAAAQAIVFLTVTLLLIAVVATVGGRGVIERFAWTMAGAWVLSITIAVIYRAV